MTKKLKRSTKSSKDAPTGKPAANGIRSARTDVRSVEAEVVSPPSAERPSLDEALDEDEKLEPRADSLELTGELSDSNWPVPVPDVAVSTALTPLSSSDPVALYLNEIKRYPLLTREQEQDLARRYHESRDPKAAEALVTSNLRFVVKVAAEYTKFGAKLIDLIQEGNVGLMHAVRDFNPYKGTRLITYAVWWIRGYIQEYLMRQYSLVRIGTTQTQRRLFYRLQKERDELERSGVVPDSALLSTRLGVTKDEVEEMQQRLGGRDLSLSQPAGEDSSWTPLDQTASADEPLDEQLGRQQLLDLLGEQISKLRPTLNEKELYLLENRLLSDEPLTLQEIGEQQGVTREAVRQTEARLIGKIRKLLQDQTE